MLDYNMINRGSESLYEFLYRSIRADIESGAIASNEHLPSKRALAEHLGVSVITVENAYAQLVAEGYVYTRPRRGFYANALPKPAASVASSVAGVSPAAGTHGVAAGHQQYATAGTEAGSILEGGSGFTQRLDAETPDNAAPREPTPSFSDAAARLWSRALRAVLASEPEQELFAPAPSQGTERLRAALATYLRQTRGMMVDPQNIVVGAGAQVLDIMLVQLLGTNSPWALEDPGYPRLTNLYGAMGVNVRHIPLDKQGVRMDGLAQSEANVLHIMPSHQFPTGTVTSIARRYGLLGWAASRADRYIIEDDYDCEFRLAGRPIPSLQGIDTTGSVIYTNTFSKSLSSALRLAYMVLPADLMERYYRELSFYSSTVSTVQQVALAHLLESGEYERHVNRMRKRARDRRDALIAALRTNPATAAGTIEAADAGLHFVYAAGEPFDEESFCTIAARHNATAAPLIDYSRNKDANEALSLRARYIVQY